MRLTTYVLAIVVMLGTLAASAREWKDSTGTYTVEAELVTFVDGVAWLKKPDGSSITVAIDQLSEADREFLRTRLNRESAPVEKHSLEELVSAVEPAVVRIDCSDGGIGSGFVVDPSGIVVTNFHVIKGVRSARISFKDRGTARVTGYLGVDVTKDIAVIKVETVRPLTVLSLRKDLPRKGENVATFGSPQGFDFSVSEGVVSSLRSHAEITRLGYKGGTADATWVQTTAPISPGNSGGPLFDYSGRAVGANTWAPNEDVVGTAQNLNFAISSVDIAKLLSECKRNPVQSLANLSGQAPSASPTATGALLNSSTDGFPLVKLPSGSTLSYMNVQVPKDWPKCSMTRETGVRNLEFPNGKPKSLHAFLNAKLHGPSLVLNEDGSKRWAADYYESNLDGALRLWRNGAEMTLFAEYVRGRRNGFVCVFQEGLPWLVQEWSNDNKLHEYLVKWNAGVPTVFNSDKLPDQSEMDELSRATTLLAQLEEELATEEAEVKRDLVEWFRELDAQIKRQRAAALNPRKRRAMVGAIQSRKSSEQASFVRAWQSLLPKR